MYTVVNRRKFNAARQAETVQRAQAEFFPRLQRAPGFTGFYLVTDEDNGTNTAIIVWESKAHSDAFEPEAEVWRQVLDSLGHALESDDRGETRVALEAAH